MNADDVKRMKQLSAVIDWLDEKVGEILDDIEIAIEEGDVEGVEKFEKERAVVANLRGAAVSELDALRQREAVNAQQRLDEWVRAVQS